MISSASFYGLTALHAWRDERVAGVICAVYCALNGHVVQAPPLRELILSRAGRAAAHLSAALRTLKQLEEAGV